MILYGCRWRSSFRLNFSFIGANCHMDWRHFGTWSESNNIKGNIHHIPTNRPAFPNSSSILNNWLYFAFLSLLAGAPVLISSAPRATEISAIVVSSVSADLWLTTTWTCSSGQAAPRQMTRRACRSGSLWGEAHSGIHFYALFKPLYIGHEKVVPMIIVSFNFLVNSAKSLNDSSSNGSSMERIGKYRLARHRNQSIPRSIISAIDFVFAILVELSGGRIKTNCDLLIISRFLYRISERIKSIGRILKRRRITAFVTHIDAEFPYFFTSIAPRVWYVSAPMRRASENVLAPPGWIMNSCIARSLPACFPPFMTFMVGQEAWMHSFRQGNDKASIPMESAAAWATASETQNGIGPSLDLFGVRQAQALLCLFHAGRARPYPGSLLRWLYWH